MAQLVAEKAYAHLRAAILRGDLEAGVVLAEAELARSLGMSRTPVRQALQMLLQEDLVQVGSRRQIVVRGMSRETRREVFIVREALETAAIREVTRITKPEDLDELRLLLLKQERAAKSGDVDRFIDFDEAFHIEMARLSRLPLLEKFVSQLRALIRLMGIQAISHSGRARRVVDEHQLIWDALERHDERAAVSALSAHLTATRRALEAVVGEGDETAVDSLPSQE